ncbi:TPR_REGION domain-containing protein, partial [Durusdinium trenchii]
AMNKSNWNLAIEMFGVAVKFVPDNLTYRQLLRQTTKKKYNDNKKGAGTMGQMKLISVRGKLKKAKAKEEWEQVCALAEEGLLINPWDAQLNVELAEACKLLDRGEIARMAYRDACEASPKDKAVHVAFAELLEDRGEYSDAVGVWRRIQQIDPQDMTARKRITDIEFKKTTERGGYSDAADTRDVMVGKGAPTAGESVAPGESVETDLRHAIRKSPEVVENYLKLAAVQKKNKRLKQDVELDLMRFNLSVAREKADASENEALRKQAAEMANELRNREIEILNARVERYPMNMALKYQLGTLLMQLQKWPQAIELLQRASQDPRLKTKALVSLGKCFIYDKKLPLAKSQLERAIPDLDFNVLPDTFKEAHYLLARVSEELKDLPTAEKHYGEVLVVDYGYRDSRERLESIQTGGSGE